VILKNIETIRLILIPMTLEVTRSLMAGSCKEVEKLGIIISENWPTDDTKDILPIILQSLEESRTPSGFETWMIVKKENMQVIGDIGFHGKSDEKGEVEVGYGLVEKEKERGNGIGFESLQAIIEWIYPQTSVKAIKADCLIDNKPSIRIVEKVGMKEINRDRNLIYWELKPVFK
jgi:[ribosomal protein S5]-alanine N-acetyltransferase